MAGRPGAPATSNERFDGADMHYRSKGYVQRGDRPPIHGVGVFGRHLVVDPAADRVIAKCSSQPLPLDKPYLTTAMAGVECLRRMPAPDGRLKPLARRVPSPGGLQPQGAAAPGRDGPN